MATKSEAQARVKIDKLLIEAGWRFFDDEKGKANIVCEDRVSKKIIKTDSLGNNFEHTQNGRVDYVLYDSNGEAVAIVEAKKEEIDPLSALDQAREYARTKRVRHIFLSNGNYHYYWDMNEMPKPDAISQFYTYEQLGKVEQWQPNPKRMEGIKIDENYIAISQDAEWDKYNATQKEKVQIAKNIRLLRKYQIAGVRAVQKAYCQQQKRRFLFEMATGTGKTLLAAAIIKMFLKSDCAKRVLFLVDRLELENQAQNSFQAYLSHDRIKSVIYKENKRDWTDAQIVVTTIQSLAIDNRYRKAFNPYDFQLVISDEAHRTISGSNKAIFEYFIGAKLGLTATPKNFLKGVDTAKLAKNDPRQLEDRQARDTYQTFGCENGEPTYRFSLEDGVKAGILCNPYVIDARTEITTELLSKEGYTFFYTDEEGEDQESTFEKSHYEKKFTSDETNRALMNTFLEHAKRDPLTDEIGKTIIFAVSRKHATKLVNILNDLASTWFPKQYGKGYHFAKQITSDLPNAQENTLKFSHDKNSLEGRTQFNSAFPEYESSRTRVCVTVGMMTTGYDCQDLLNIVLCRPIMSPTEFIQIKGRGTRLYLFEYNKISPPPPHIQKDTFYLFDFFANYEYFEKEFNYHEKIKLPTPKEEGEGNGESKPLQPDLNYTGGDDLESLTKTKIAPEGMKVDREMFAPRFEQKTKDAVWQNPELRQALELENWAFLEAYVRTEIFDKPKEYWNVDKLCEAYDIDRRLTVKEILMKVFGKIDSFENRTDLANKEFAYFLSTIQDENLKAKYQELKKLFHAYLLYEDVRIALDTNKYAKFVADHRLTSEDLKTLGKKTIQDVQRYILDNLNLNHFKKPIF